MRARRVGLLLVIVGVVLGLVAGITVYLQVGQVQARLAELPKTWVVIASANIDERTVIAPAQIALVQVPDQVVPAGSVSYLPPGGASAEEIQRQQTDLITRVNGKFTPNRINRGEIINSERLGQEALKNTPSFELPQGKVAYPFPVRVQGGSPSNDRVIIAFLNAVRPGDFIDIYWTTLELPPGLSQEEEDRLRSTRPANHLYTRAIMQNIKVLNVGFFPDQAGKVPETGRDERFLTLEVTPDEALRLKWLKDAATFGGNIELILRSRLDTGPLAPNTTVSFDTMSSEYRVGTRQ